VVDSLQQQHNMLHRLTCGVLIARFCFREFLQVIQVPTEVDLDGEGAEVVLEYDPVWLATVRKTHNLLSTGRQAIRIPQTAEFVSEAEAQWVRDRLHAQLGYEPGASLRIPTFEEAVAYIEQKQHKRLLAGGRTSSLACGDAQTDMLLHLLELDHRWTQSVCEGEQSVGHDRGADPHEIDIDDV
jgi:hypothetical protein